MNHTLNVATEIVTIPLSKRKNSKYQGMFVAIVSIEDEDLADLNWSVHHASNKKGQYAFRRELDENGAYTVNIGMHQLILERILGRDLEEGEYCDHIDGDGLNNQRGNLRLTTRSGNAQNRRILTTTKTGYKGVHQVGKYYRATITYNRKIYQLGTYETAEAAHEAYKARALELHGEFANDGEKSLINTSPPVAHIAKRRTVTNRPNKYSGYVGVLPHDSGLGFVAYINHEKKRYYLGFRKTAEKAYELRLLAEERITNGLHPKTGEPLPTGSEQ